MTQPNHVPDAWDSASQRNGSVMAHRVRRKYTAFLLAAALPSASAAGELPARHCTKGWVQDGFTPCPEELNEEAPLL